MKSILCLIAGLGCIALTGCHTNSHSGGYSYQYSSQYGYYSPQASQAESVATSPAYTAAQKEGKYDATTTYSTGLYPQPAPVVTTEAAAGKTDTSAAGGVGSSTTSSQEWINIPVGETTFTPKPAPVTTTPETQVQPKAQPQPQPESRYVEPQGGVSTTYSTQQGYQIREKHYDKSGPPYSAFRGTDEHWYDPEW